MSEPTTDIVESLKAQGFSEEEAYDLIISLGQMLRGEGEIVIKREESGE